MDIVLERTIPIEDAFACLRSALLENAGGQEIRFYQNARLRLADVYPDELNPAALYILRDNLEFQRALREHLLREYRIDTLQLSSVLHLKTPNGLIGMAPPYVEISEEMLMFVGQEGDRRPPGRLTLRMPLLIDGFHRAYLAHENGLPVRCVVASNLPRAYAYCAYPCAWDQVAVHDAVPKVKKFYRRQDAYTFMRPLDALRQLPNTAGPEYGRA